MTIFTTGSDSTSSIVAETAADTWLIKQDVTLSTSGAAISGSTNVQGRQFIVEGNIVADNGSGIGITWGSNTDVVLTATGSIVSDATGISVQAASGTHIENQGSVFGGTNGISTSGDGFEMTNDGHIAGGSYGFLHSGDMSELINTGTISGKVYGVNITGAMTTISNAGEILGGTYGIYLTNDTGDANVIDNSGTISAKFAILTNNSWVELNNSGDIHGDVNFGNGGDTFNDSGSVIGDVYMGRGQDVVRFTNSASINGNIDLGDEGDAIYLHGASVSGQISGGLGGDVYVVDRSDVDLYEAQDGGDDYVESFADWSLGDNFENLTLRGQAAISGHGNELDNELFGNKAANGIFGEAGDDLLVGGRGADILAGGAGVDTAAYFNSTEGVTIDLAAGTGSGGEAEGDRLTSIEKVTGSGFDDVLRGDKQDNTLYSGSGSDVLDGRGGNDHLDGGDGSDTFVFSSGYGQDVIDWFEFGGKQHDVIDLSGLTGIDSYKDLIKHHLTVAEDSFVISGIKGETLTIMKSDAESLHAFDFHF